MAHLPKAAQGTFDELLAGVEPNLAAIARRLRAMIRDVDARTVETVRLPSEEDVQPWVDAVCALWDDLTLYQRMATRARQIAEERYSEQASRKQHVDYLTSLGPGGRLFV